MDLHLRGKSVLITGASKGIGAATAEAFAEEGSNVHLAALDQSTSAISGAEQNATIDSPGPDLSSQNLF